MKRLSNLKSDAILEYVELYRPVDVERLAELFAEEVVTFNLNGYLFAYWPECNELSFISKYTLMTIQKFHDSCERVLIGGVFYMHYAKNHVTP